MKTALILGCADSIWTDAANALQIGSYDLTIAINNFGTRWSNPLDLWCTLHPENMAGWRADRKRAGYPHAGHHIGHIPAEGVDEGREYKFVGQTGSGSSGLFAVKVAVDEGCDRIVLAGVPMAEASRHHDDNQPWQECTLYLPAWESVLPLIKGRVRSMSGWTAEKLGAPSTEWLNG